MKYTTLFDSVAQMADSITKIVTDCIVLPVWKDGELGDGGKALNTALNGTVQAIATSGDYIWEIGDRHLLYKPHGCDAARVLLVGAGDREKFGRPKAAKFLAEAVRAVLAGNMPNVHFALSDLAQNDVGVNWLASRLAQEGETGNYRYVTTKEDQKRKPVLAEVSIPTADGIEQALIQGQAIGKAVNVTRELGNLPGNICTPTFLAKFAEEFADKHDAVGFELLGEAEMEELGMGCFLSVTAGSVEPAFLISLHYRGAGEDAQPICLVGKGVTFDSGGTSMKPPPNMDHMKWDMCGGAAVLGALQAIAEMKLPINVVALVAASENMPGGKATKPGDVVTSLSGKTVEILNTDAEGRLLLADALTYAERFNPSHVIDIATLTGSAVAAFGHEANVLMGSDQALINQLLDCGERCLDRAWQMPLWDSYQKPLDSNFADVANVGSNRLAGAITAGCFLSRFAKQFRWAHLDIAGTAWHSTGAKKGATGRPVPLLMEYLIDCADERQEATGDS